MITIRQMQEKDTDAVAKLEAEIFSQPWSVKGFQEALHLGSTVFLVAEENGKILGYIGMYFSLDEGEITNVAVAPSERCRGVGKLLIEEMKKEAECRGITGIVLEVRVSNESAIRLYERSGFTICGVRKRFYEFPEEDACIMIYGQ